MLWAIRSDTIGANLPCLHLRPLQESVHREVISLVWLTLEWPYGVGDAKGRDPLLFRLL